MLAALVTAFIFINFVKSLILFLFFVCALLLILIILLQEPKGGGLAAAFGGAGAETFGVQSGGVNKFTATLATAFMALAILYAAIRPAGMGDYAPTDETASPALVTPPEPPAEDTGGSE